RAAFLRSICDARGADAVRLIFADWLDENGEPERAEFIRLQCDRARRVEPLPACAEEVWREEELLARFGDTWRAELPELSHVRWGNFERGFVNLAEADNLDGFRWSARAVRSRTPVRRFRLSRIRRLDERDLTYRNDLRMLTTLDLSGSSIGWRGARALASCRYLTGLRELELDDNRVGDHGVEVLAASPHLAGLTKFGLRSNSLTAAGARSLAESPFLTRLHELDLGGVDPYHGGDNHVGAEGVAALAASSTLSNLRSLRLDWNELDDEAVRLLASTKHLTHLHALELWANQIGAAGAAALARSPALGGLVVLSLPANQIGPEGAAAL